MILLRRSLFLALATILLLSSTVFASSTQIRSAFLEHERNGWREYIRRFPDGTVTSDFDVTFYHLDVEIGAIKPRIQGNVLCRFESTIDSLRHITLDLHHAL